MFVGTSPRPISRAERERRATVRLHRGAPPNVSSSDLREGSRLSSAMLPGGGGQGGPGGGAVNSGMRRGSTSKDFTEAQPPRVSSSRHLKK